MDVSFVISQQSVSFAVAEVVNINNAMILNFTSVSDTLVNSAFIGKTLDDIAVIANGTELDTQSQVTILDDTITLLTSLEGSGRAKVIVI